MGGVETYFPKNMVLETVLPKSKEKQRALSSKSFIPEFSFSLPLVYHCFKIRNRNLVDGGNSNRELPSSMVLLHEDDLHFTVKRRCGCHLLRCNKQPEGK